MEQTQLPEMCYLTLSNGQRVILSRGEPGFRAVPESVEPGRTSEELNAALGVTPEQCRAMEIGAAFGFDKPGANPAFIEQLKRQRLLLDLEAQVRARRPKRGGLRHAA